MVCSTCGGKGHNSRTCVGEEVAGAIHKKSKLALPPRKAEKCGCEPCLCGRALNGALSLRTHELSLGGWLQRREAGGRCGPVAVEQDSGWAVEADLLLGLGGGGALSSSGPAPSTGQRYCPCRWVFGKQSFHGGGGVSNQPPLLDGSLAATVRALMRAGTADERIDALLSSGSSSGPSHSGSGPAPHAPPLGHPHARRGPALAPGAGQMSGGKACSGRVSPFAGREVSDGVSANGGSSSNGSGDDGSSGEDGFLGLGGGGGEGQGPAKRRFGSCNDLMSLSRFGGPREAARPVGLVGSSAGFGGGGAAATGDPRRMVSALPRSGSLSDRLGLSRVFSDNQLAGKAVPLSPPRTTGLASASVGSSQAPPGLSVLGESGSGPEQDRAAGHQPHPHHHHGGDGGGGSRAEGGSSEGGQGVAGTLRLVSKASSCTSGGFNDTASFFIDGDGDGDGEADDLFGLDDTSMF